MKKSFSRLHILGGVLLISGLVFTLQLSNLPQNLSAALSNPSVKPLQVTPMPTATTSSSETTTPGLKKFINQVLTSTKDFSACRCTSSESLTRWPVPAVYTDIFGSTNTNCAGLNGTKWTGYAKDKDGYRTVKTKGTLSGCVGVSVSIDL